MEKINPTFVFFDVITGEPPCHLPQGALPPATLLPLRHRDDIPLFEAQLIVVLAFEGINSLHQVRITGHLCYCCSATDGLVLLMCFHR